MKHTTCPKSPSHDQFKELVEIQGRAWMLLDDRMRPFDTEPPHESEVIHRSTVRQCAICGATPIIRLPF